MDGEVPTHLNLAIARRDKKVDLVGLIEICADVNSADAYIDTPLHAAIRNRCALKVIKALVAKGANVEAQDYYLRTPLHVAFHCVAEKSIIIYLLRNTENVNITDVWQRTLLHMAVSTFRDHTILRLLITKGANLEAQDNRGRTPLHIAIDNRKIRRQPMDHLLNITKNVNSTDSKMKRTLLHAAIEENCDPEIIRTLVEKGANLDAIDGKGRTPLHTVFDFSYKPMNETLYESMYRAIYKLYPTFYDQVVDIFLFLIKNTSNINRLDADGRTPLYYAFLRRHRHSAVIRALVENGANFNCPDSSVFRLAADKDRLSVFLEAFPEELKDLKRIIVSPRVTLYSALVLGRPHDWNCVDRPLECLTERNKPFWSVIMSSIVAQRPFSLRLHSAGVHLEEESTLHVINFLRNCDVINLLLAFRHCLHLKRRSDSPIISPTLKHQKKL